MPTIEKAAAKDVATTTPAPRFLPLETISVRLKGPSIPGREPVFGIVSNMSETGACIITNRTVPEDASIEVSIEGKQKQARLTVPARVIWCAERMEPVKEIVGYLTGVCFENTDDSVKNLLSSGIFQLVP